MNESEYPDRKPQPSVALNRVSQLIEQGKPAEDIRRELAAITYEAVQWLGRSGSLGAAVEVMGDTSALFDTLVAEQITFAKDAYVEAATMVELATREFVDTARAAGIPEAKIRGANEYTSDKKAVEVAGYQVVMLQLALGKLQIPVSDDDIALLTERIKIDSPLQ